MLRLQKQHTVATERGFTLLELLVVMVIIGLLAAYVGPKYFSQVGKSEIKMAQAQIDALEKALHQYRLDVGSYPATEQGLAALNTRPSNESRWQGPYLAKMPPSDPWGGLISINIRESVRNLIYYRMGKMVNQVARARQPISRIGRS